MQMIGIIGNTPIEAATLYATYVNAVAQSPSSPKNSYNAVEDIDHPPAVIIGLPGEDLAYKAEIARGLGAKHILATEADITAFIDINRTEKPHDFLSPIAPIEHLGTFIGIIGGNGPYSSAVYARELAKCGASFILLSATQNGHKEPDLVRYKNILASCGADKITIPCNGAYNNRNAASTKGELSIIDVTIDALQEEGQIIVFGSGNGRKPYRERLGSRLIEPNSTLQEDITRLIYAGKDEGQANIVKEGIIEVARHIRETAGEATPIIIACTELCCPFSPDELKAHNFISTLHLLAEKAGLVRRPPSPQIHQVSEEASSVKSMPSNLQKGSVLLL